MPSKLPLLLDNFWTSYVGSCIRKHQFWTSYWDAFQDSVFWASFQVNCLPRQQVKAACLVSCYIFGIVPSEPIFGCRTYWATQVEKKTKWAACLRYHKRIPNILSKKAAHLLLRHQRASSLILLKQFFFAPTQSILYWTSHTEFNICSPKTDFPNNAHFSDQHPWYSWKESMCHRVFSRTYKHAEIPLGIAKLKPC